MMVTFVSQCEKKALAKTRRVLDAFANRIGDNTWQTLITEDGLKTVKKMLGDSSTKSTAVSCHWIRSRSQSQLLWIVGSKRKFNSEGIVPVNFTEKDVMQQEQFSLNMDIIANLAAIAGYFHDIGKANTLFQAKIAVEPNEELQPNKKLRSYKTQDHVVSGNNDLSHNKKYEPLRHEWVSLRLFQAFVGEQTDKDWIKSLTTIDNDTEETLLLSLEPFKDLLVKDVCAIDASKKDVTANVIPSPFTTLPPIAKTVAWLIVSHHRLPQFHECFERQPSLSDSESWLSVFEPAWNSPQAVLEKWSDTQIRDNWSFPLGTPFKSAFWQTNIANLAQRTLKCQRLFESHWHQNLFTKHLARLALMLADHAESSREDVDNSCSDRNYLAFANTDTDDDGQVYQKQKLDEHNIHVGKLAYNIACELPGLKMSLSALERVKPLEARVPEELRAEFGWQDKAAKLAKEIKDKTEMHGFFGISMASTGKGKTRANAKIMYALSDPDRCRFSVALGLRTLSIQTAKALRNDLFGNEEVSGKSDSNKSHSSNSIAKEKIALLVGSQAVRDLQQVSLTSNNSEEDAKGSQSKEPLLKDDVELLENLDLATLIDTPWLEHDPKIKKLLSAPVLVSTIDYLIPATEGVRGGRQIGPMLRLLTSDLVLDEPDDFSLEDMPAVCRLVNWAGMLGSRVLISSATISPSFAKSLFEAYKEGRRHFTAANGEQDHGGSVCCAWFDECNKPQEFLVKDTQQYSDLHNNYVQERVLTLKKQQQALRKGQLVPVVFEPKQKMSSAIADTIYQSITQLHESHQIKVVDKSVSIGLVRMANINPLVQVSQLLIARDAPANTCIHYCVYHSQYPLLQRTSIEQLLDKALMRHDAEKWQADSGIIEIISKSKATNHVFVVMATAVAEVGRDHDYDWAVVEPSSTRSIIQLAGRVQRHRKLIPNLPNIHVLSQNFRGLTKKSDEAKFVKPGFESKKIRYASGCLEDLNVEAELSAIDATPRVIEPENVMNSSIGLNQDNQFVHFSRLEHVAQNVRLTGRVNFAAQWWREDVTWCGEIQRHQPFRKSRPTDDYCLAYARQDKIIWRMKEPNVFPVSYQPTKNIQVPADALDIGDGVSLWHKFNLNEQVSNLAQTFGADEEHILATYTHVSLGELNKDSDEVWFYRTELGIYKIIKKDTYHNDE